MELIIIGLLILLNALFSLSEIALISSKRARLEHMRIEGSKGAKTALHLLSNSENFLSAIQVGITLIGIITGVYGGVNIADDVTPFFDKFDLTSTYSHQIALVVTVIVITYVSIVIGELVPKTIALNYPEKIAATVAPFIYFFSAAFFPFVRLLSLSTSLINNLIGIKKQTNNLTESELRHMIRLASTEGIIEKEQNIIHEKVFYFSDKKARHIMTHRTDVEWIDLNKPNDVVQGILSSVQHSKILCSKGRLDNFIGILYLRDYYKAILQKKKFRISDLMIQPIIVPENADATKVLKLFRQKKIHICCVVNEYGGFEGIITLHDIIENIVGEMPDEGEPYEQSVFVREDKSVLVSGDAPVETLAEIIEDFTIDFEKIDYSTVAGFVFNRINKIPQIGDQATYKGYNIEIVDIDGNKIDKVLIKKIK